MDKMQFKSSGPEINGKEESVHPPLDRIITQIAN
jgi:hypothetical protein